MPHSRGGNENDGPPAEMPETAIIPMAPPDHGITICQAGLLACGSKPPHPSSRHCCQWHRGRLAHRLQLRDSSGSSPDSLLASTGWRKNHDGANLHCRRPLSTACAASEHATQVSFVQSIVTL